MSHLKIVILNAGNSGPPLCHPRDAVLQGVLQPAWRHHGHARPHQLLHQLHPLLLHVHPVPEHPVQDAEQEGEVIHGADQQHHGAPQVNRGVKAE